MTAEQLKQFMLVFAAHSVTEARTTSPDRATRARRAKDAVLAEALKAWREHETARMMTPATCRVVGAELALEQAAEDCALFGHLNSGGPCARCGAST